jgi:hopene-associated glycosyltransferase HpnB
MILALLALLIWLYLFFLHGQFWQSTPELRPAPPVIAPGAAAPPVDIIVPARDEAAMIGPVIASLLAQDYPGVYRIILVDDRSADNTAGVAREAAKADPRLRIITGTDKPPGWAGKLWALSQGVSASRAPLIFFTDADIVHDPAHLSALVARLETPRVDMVSEMVLLHCASFAERALIPAFVYFFQMLYPFAQVNNPLSAKAAAAGGTVLIRRRALERIGGISAIRGALIDDVTLARAVKQGGPVFLGHSGLARSIRPYPHFAEVWTMIARSAFTQLRYSSVLLAFAIIGLALVWLVPVFAVIFGEGATFFCGLIAYLLAVGSFFPTLARYRLRRAWALALPLIALFYMAATIDSALAYWQGRGARWKNRAYAGSGA